jgi:choline transport protein
MEINTMSHSSLSMQEKGKKPCTRTQPNKITTITLTVIGNTVEGKGRDGAALAKLGIEEVAKRDIGMLTIICTGWNISNAWAAVAGTIVLAISSGGTVTIIYGIIVVFILGGASAASLAELASVYPTAGGQYHWTSILAPKRWNRGLVRAPHRG